MYCTAALPNAGLANKLFPWARCRVFSLEHGIEMLTPRWTQLKLGPLLRRDRDARLYHNLFKRTPPGQLSGVRSWWVRQRSRSIDEPEDLHVAPVDRSAGQVVVLRGERDHFGTLNGWHEPLLAELRAMTRDRWLHRADAVEAGTIGIHVRRGDFAEAASAEDFILRGAIRTPLEWFVESLLILRQMCGFAAPALVVSDAADPVLGELLHAPSVTRIDTGSAIGDLLVLGKTQLLIASGGSSFSAWAAFLGQMPTIAYPGQSLAWFKIAPTRGQYLGEFHHEQATPPLLLEQVRTLRFAHGHPALRSG